MSTLANNQKRPIIAVGVDGTSSAEWRNKQTGFNSHTYQFFKKLNIPSADKQFYDGPSDYVSGRSVEIALQDALAFIKLRLRFYFGNRRINFNTLEMANISRCYSYFSEEDQSEKMRQLQYLERSYGKDIRKFSTFTPPVSERQLRQPDKKLQQALSTNDVWIVLVGHSRGAIATTELAKMLAPLVKVFFMGMYDAVDREPCLDSSHIQNVQFTCHARRNASEMNSRNSFSNTATVSTESYVERYFDTSHGGMGGDINTKSTGAFNKYLNMGVDTTCVPNTTRTYINPKTGMRSTVVEKHNWVEDSVFQKPGNSGKTIDQICAAGRDDAKKWLENQARAKGIPLL